MRINTCCRLQNDTIRVLSFWMHPDSYIISSGYYLALRSGCMYTQNNSRNGDEYCLRPKGFFVPCVTVLLFLLPAAGPRSACLFVFSMG